MISFDGVTPDWPTIHLREDTFMERIFNFRRRKVGGIWFVRLGRLQFSFCLCRAYERKYCGGNTVVANVDR